MPEDQISRDFIGREAELRIFKQWLDNAQAPGVLYFYDALEDPEKKGGAGKTWLLKKCAMIAEDQQEHLAVAMIDFFNVTDRDAVVVAQRITESVQKVYPDWQPASFEKALIEYREASAHRKDKEIAELRDTLFSNLTGDLQLLEQKIAGANKRLVVFLDTFERIEQNPIIAVLGSEQVFPDTYHFKHVGFVLAGRYPLNWNHPNWRGRQKEVQTVAINPFSHKEMMQLLNKQLDIEPFASDSIEATTMYARTQGRPILIGLLVDVLNHRAASLSDLLAVPEGRFESYLVARINNLENPVNWIVLFMAHIYHRFNYELLEWIFSYSLNVRNLVSDIKTFPLAQKMLNLSFVRRASTGDDFVLHDEMRRLVNLYAWPLLAPNASIYQQELSKCAISYYEYKMADTTDQQLLQTYTVEMLYHKLFLDKEAGLTEFKRYFRRAIDLWQTAFARSLLQEVQQFRQEFSSEQFYSTVMAEATLLRIEGNNEEALKLYDWLEQQASKEWFAERHSDIVFEKGNCYQQMSRLVEATSCFTTVLQIDTEKGNLPRVAISLGRLGFVSRRAGELEKAAEYYEKSIAIHKQLGNQIGYANALNTLGNVYRLKGKMDDALRHCNVAWRIRRDQFNKGNGSEVALGLSLSTIGIIYLKMGDFGKAEKFFHDAFDIFERNNYKKGVAAMYTRFGQIAMAQSKLAPAEEYFQRGYKASQGIDAETEINSLNKLGWVCVLRNRMDEAIPLLTSAIDRAEQVNDYYQLAESLIDLADVFERLQRREESLLTLQKAEEIARQYNYNYLLGIANEFQGDNAYRVARYSTAFIYFGEFCHYMALYNPFQYEKAVRKTIDLLLNISLEEEVIPILNALNAYWLALNLKEENSLMLNALREIRTLIEV